MFNPKLQVDNARGIHDILNKKIPLQFLDETKKNTRTIFFMFSIAFNQSKP
jgi:hypothetical protein